MRSGTLLQSDRPKSDFFFFSIKQQKKAGLFPTVEITWQSRAKAVKLEHEDGAKCGNPFKRRRKEDSFSLILYNICFREKKKVFLNKVKASFFIFRTQKVIFNIETKCFI